MIDFKTHFLGDHGAICSEKLTAGCIEQETDKGNATKKPIGEVKVSDAPCPSVSTEVKEKGFVYCSTR